MDRVVDVILRKPIHCPWCKKECDMALGLMGNNTPEPGDIFLCIGCGKFALWFGASHLRKPTWDEFQEAMSIPEVILAWLAWKAMMLEQKQQDQRRG